MILPKDARLAQVCREFRPEQFKPANIWLNPIPGTVPPEGIVSPSPFFVCVVARLRDQPTIEILLQVLTATYNYLV